MCVWVRVEEEEGRGFVLLEVVVDFFLLFLGFGLPAGRPCLRNSPILCGGAIVVCVCVCFVGLGV